MFKTKKFRLVASMLLIVSLLIPFSVTTVHAEGFVTNTVAISNTAQTVYTGPGTDYVSAGSISDGERVYIMDKEPGMNWYRIVYNVNGSPAQNSGYVPTNTMDVLTNTPQEANYSNGFQAYSAEDQAVYSGPTMDIVDGSIGYHEGITVFYTFTPTNLPTRTAYYIEYSTSSGPKRGYIIEGIIKNDDSGVARVNNNADLYYGLSTSNFAKAGTVYANETVTILQKSNDWVYIEYDTNSGRKRGYLSQGHLHKYRPTGFEYADMPYDYYAPVDNVIEARRNVYAGPSSAYPVIGYVENEIVKSFGYFPPDGANFIRYNTSSGYKCGFLVN